MMRTSNGGCGHDVVVKFLSSPKDMETCEGFGEFVVKRVAEAWPGTEPVVLASVLKQPGDHEDKVVYVAIHSSLFFRSRVAHSHADPHNLIVTQEKVTSSGPYFANAVLEVLTDCPSCVLAVGVSAVSPSYMAELWGLMQDPSYFEPAADHALVVGQTGVEKHGAGAEQFGWDGLL